MGDVVLLDELEVLLGVEALHDHDGAAGADRQAGRALRRGVVQRRRRQVDLPLPVAPRAMRNENRASESDGVVSGRARTMPFGRPGRARRVEHRAAEELVVDRRVRVLRRLLEEVDERAAVASAAGRRSRSTRRNSSSFGHWPIASSATAQRLAGDDQRLRVAVVDDVGQLVTGEVRVDRRVVEPAALPCAAALQVPRVVLHEDRVVVEPLQSVGAEQVGEAVGARLVVGVGDRLAGAGHDDRRLIGALDRVLAWVHRPQPPGSSDGPSSGQRRARRR